MGLLGALGALSEALDQQGGALGTFFSFILRFFARFSQSGGPMITKFYPSDKGLVKYF